jgi:hypothetical protein
MRFVRRRFLKLLGTGTLAALAQAHAAPREREREAKASLSLGAAINKAGRQRMLTQRMAKAYLMIGQGVLPERAGKLLAESAALFEAQLAELRELVPDHEVHAALVALGEQWRVYVEALATPSDRGSAEKIYKLSDALLAVAHRLTLAYEKQAATPAGHLVSVAGRQRMLSQRMAKFYLFRAWAINPQPAQQELEIARKEFVAGLAELNAAPQNTARIKAELELVNQQWLFFDTALAASYDGTEIKRGLQDVATTSERILEAMENVVGLYEGLVR